MSSATERRLGDHPPVPTGNPRIYTARQAQYRRIEAHRAPRRMRLADDVQLVWESETTIDHLIAEVLWPEEDPESRAAIQAEYAPLMPTPRRPTATLTIEAPDPDALAPKLRAYAGLERSLALSDGRVTAPVDVIHDRRGTDAAMPVTYLAFPLPPEFNVTAAVLRATHPRLAGTWPVPAIAFQP